MELRSASSLPIHQCLAPEEADSTSENAGTGGAPSASLQEPRRGTEGAGGAPSTPPGEYDPLAPDCTIELAVAIAACRDAVLTQSFTKAVACLAETEEAVACLVERLRE